MPRAKSSWATLFTAFLTSALTMSLLVTGFMLKGWAEHVNKELEVAATDRREFREELLQIRSKVETTNLRVLSSLESRERIEKDVSHLKEQLFALTTQESSRPNPALEPRKINP